ncbi:hypothetical protein R6Q57_004429 [Mikania cordata]
MILTTTNSLYNRNLDAALASLPKTNSGYGYFNASAGQGTYAAYTICLCRGDVVLNMCQSCLGDAIFWLRHTCLNQSEAVIYYEHCLLKYSNDPKLGNNVITSNNCFNSFSNNEQANGLLGPFKYNLSREAASGSSLLKFAMENKTGPGKTTLNGLTQCVPSLTETECVNCLEYAINQLFSTGCGGRVGAIVLMVRCNVRYEIYGYDINPAVLSPPSRPLTNSHPSPSIGKKSSTTRIIMFVMIPTVSAIVIASVCIFIILKRKKTLVKKDNTMDISIIESLQYDFETVKAATNGFSDNKKLGEGGFGSVYKGDLQNGQEIAVKRLSENSGQGEIEFKNEVMLVAKLHHRNLVRFLGFSLEGTERVLIYEFMPNASLDQFIFDPTKCAILDWNRRNNIIKGIARGLLYLHEDSRLRIIHRDLKASNILLDEDMNPKIADFGMARLLKLQETQGCTNRVVGTYGYMPPEYIMHGQFSVKSDVFSFGVLALEIITGQKNQCFKIKERTEFLLSYAWKSWRYEALSDMIDPTLLVESSSLQEIMRTIRIALLCVQNNVVDRPIMPSVVLMLNSSSLTLQLPSEPAFFMRSSSTSGSTNYNQISSHSSTLAHNVGNGYRTSPIHECHENIDES